MKARDYAAIYLEKRNDGLPEIITGFFDEINEMIRNRHANKDSAVAAILDELSLKWKRFAAMTGGDIRLDGFERLLEKRMPGFYAAWQNHKRGQNFKRLYIESMTRRKIP